MVLIKERRLDQSDIQANTPLQSVGGPESLILISDTQMMIVIVVLTLGKEGDRGGVRGGRWGRVVKGGGRKEWRKGIKKGRVREGVEDGGGGGV